MRNYLVAAAGALALGIAATTPAQTTKPIGLSIRAGVDFPTNSGSGLSTTLFGAGLEFKLQDLNTPGLGSPSSAGRLTLSADYYGKNSAYNIPVLLNYVGTNNEFFYSVGAGLAFTKFNDVDSSGNSVTRNKTGFGYQAGIGYNFATSATPLFVEAKYFGSSNSKVNAIGVYVGIRL